MRIDEVFLDLEFLYALDRGELERAAVPFIARLGPIDQKADIVDVNAVPDRDKPVVRPQTNRGECRRALRVLLRPEVNNARSKKSAAIERQFPDVARVLDSDR